MHQEELKEIQNSNLYFAERNLWQFLRDSITKCLRLGKLHNSPT